MVVLGILCVIGLGSSYFLVHERLKAKSTQNPITVKIAFYQMTHNKYMIVMMILFIEAFPQNKMI